MRKIISKIEVLSQDEIEKIHRSSLEILETVGIKVPHKEWLEICDKAGVDVDYETQLIKIPPKLMEEVIEINRKRVKENPIKKSSQLQGHISTQVHLYDYKSRTRRTGLMKDLYKGLQLVEELPNIAEYNAFVIPHDVSYDVSDVVSYESIYKYSTKPGGTYVLSPNSAKYICQMANVMGKKIDYLLETVSPLQFRDEVLEISLEFIKQGHGLAMAPMVMAGGTGPVTMAGMLTVQNAEVLASLLLIYLASDEFAAYEVGGHAMDLQTTLCSFGNPNQALIGLGVAQLGDYYGLPTRTNSGLTDALYPDFQAGVEKAITATFSCLAGTRDIGCQGIVGADQGNSFEQIVIDNEWISMYNYIHQGIEVTDETIGLEAIKSAGIGGHFLMEDHTLIHMRDTHWPTRLFNRDNWETWSNKGAKETYDKAHEMVEEIFANAKPLEPVIEQGKVTELEYLSKKAQEEAAKNRKK